MMLQRLHIFRFRLGVAALCLLLLWLLASPALAGTAVELQPEQSIERVDLQADFMVVPEGGVLTPQQALAAWREGKYDGNIPEGSGSDPFARNLWIAVKLVNRSQGEEDNLRRVAGLGGIFLVLPQAYLAGPDEQPVTILDGEAGTGGELSPRYFTYVRTRSFEIAGGDERVLLINTTLADRPTVGIFREGELGGRQVVAMLIKTAFTLTLLIIGIVLAVISIVTGRRIGLLIAIGYSLVMLQADASLFTTTFASTPWIGRQYWEGLTLLATLFLYYSFLYAFRGTLRLESKRWLASLAIVLPLPLIWVAAVSDVTLHILWAYYASLLMLTCIIAFRFDIAPRLRLIAGAIMLASVIGAVLVEPYYLGRNLPDLTIEFLRDTLRLLAAMGILFMVLVDVRRSRLERDRLTAERIEALSAQAESQRKLLEAEREYRRAREAASRRQRQLAAASHDIRQPIVGLRQALAQESDGISPALQSRLGEAIDYLERLTNEYSDREPVDSGSFEEEAEAYPLDLVLRTVDDMFRTEAEAAGIILDVRQSDAQTQVPALALIRTVSNLVANAIRHSGASHISVFVTDGEAGVLEVHDDGKGMNSAELERLLSAGEKGEGSDGDGLGLAIVQELADRHGITFTMSSAPGQGCTARIDLPDSK